MTSRWLPALMLVVCLFAHVSSALAKGTYDSRLSLSDVLASVAETHPQLQAARERVRAAEGGVKAARGGFDPQLRLRGQVAPLGFFKNGRFEAEVRQPTPLWGITVYGGWRIGLGEFAVYDLRAKTASAGELRAGVTVPLWQGGPIDRRRADLRVSALGEDIARAEAEARLLELERAATRAYWSWVGAGLRSGVVRRLLVLAEEREGGLERQIQAGNTAAVEALDNRRAILDRRTKLVAAERAVQQAALALGRHLRDERGVMRAPTPEQLPGAFPEPASAADHDLDLLIERAIERRPELRRLALQREAAAVELKLARNNRSPRIDLEGYVARDFGRVAPSDAYLLPPEAGAAVTVELPLGLRRARGELRRAEAELARVDAELRFYRDVVAAEVRDAHSALEAARGRVELARELLKTAGALAEAERARFRMGDSTLMLVNLRESDLADAAAVELDALTEYHNAVADLHAATARALSR